MEKQINQAKRVTKLDSNEFVGLDFCISKRTQDIVYGKWNSHSYLQYFNIHNFEIMLFYYYSSTYSTS